MMRQLLLLWGLPCALLCLLLGFASLASAQTAPPPPAPPAPPASTATANQPPVGGAFFSNLDAVGPQLRARSNGSINKLMFNIGLGIAETSIRPAFALAGSLIILFSIFEFIRLIDKGVGGRFNMRETLFALLPPAFFTSLVLTRYERYVTLFAGDGGMLDGIRKFAGDPSIIMFDLYAAVLRMVARAIAQGWAAVSEAGVLHFITMLAALGDLLSVMLFVLVILVICLLGIGEIFGLLLFPGFLTAVGVAFGPYFLALLPIPWTREYAHRWISFMVANAVFAAALAVCLTIATGIFKEFDFNGMTDSGLPQATGLAIVAVVLASVNSLIQQVVQTVNALVPGGIGVARGAGDGVRGAAQVGMGGIKGFASGSAAAGSKVRGLFSGSKGKGDEKPAPAASRSPKASAQNDWGD